jgi:regulator of nucleoside diphosphate kinase
MNDIVQQSAKPQIIVSEADQGRLTTLAMDALNRHPLVAAELLAEMERALVTSADALPSGVVQMGSTVIFRSEDGETRRVTLVFPGQADISKGKISILTPVGAALIGLSLGQSITWSTRDGTSRRLTVVAVEDSVEA